MAKATEAEDNNIFLIDETEFRAALFIKHIGYSI